MAETHNRRSIFYVIAVMASLAVFVFIAMGIFLPLVKVNGGESITIYNVVKEIVDFFKNIKDATFDKVVAIVSLVRSIIVISLALALLVRVILCFFKFIGKNIKNLFTANDYYGEDMISVCVQVAIFSMMMYAYYPSWDYDIGLAFMNIAALLGIIIVAFLRVIEGLKSDTPGKAFIHAILMFGVAVLIFVTISVGMHSPVANAAGGPRIAMIDELTNYFTRVFSDFSKDVIVALIMQIVALFLFFDAFKCMGSGVQYSLGCVKKSRWLKKQHKQKEYHFKTFLSTLLGLAFLVGAIILVIIKSEEAYGVKYVMGRTGIVSIILLSLALILIIIAKYVKPKENTYEKAEAKEELAEQKEEEAVQQKIEELKKEQEN